MESVLNYDVLDAFGLGNDQEIDFETAYKMISNLDNDMSGIEHDLTLNKTGYGVSENLDNVALSYTMDDSRAMDDQAHREREEADGWKHNQDKEALKDHSDGEETFAKADLLSRYESSAIEHFLDSLVFQDNDATITEQQNETISMADLKMTNAALEVYVPPAVTLPQLSIKDEDIPKDVLRDPARLRKWKHVESERLRRNSTKKVFDDLIAMTRYPRVGNTKISKPQTEKRVPKHTLLNFILEDLKMILHANEELEYMLRKDGGKTNTSTENGVQAL